jgi:hypothetical protein
MKFDLSFESENNYTHFCTNKSTKIKIPVKKNRPRAWGLMKSCVIKKVFLQASKNSLLQVEAFFSLEEDGSRRED